MKVLLYTERLKTVGKSGLGKAIEHQKKALKSQNIIYTIDVKDKYDIAHINWYLLKSYLLAKKCHRKGIKVVYHAHSTEEDYKNGFILSKQTSKLFKWWITKCYNLGDVIVTPTEYSKKILEGYGIKKKIYAISNGIELDLFKRDKDSGKEFRKFYNYTDSDKVIIGIGLYIERKGICDFIELARRLPEYKFIWFGYSNPKLSGKKVNEYLNNIPSNMKLAGYVDQKMIKNAMNGCDLYLFPTLEETEGIPLIEACACKTNTIIRDIPIFDYEFKDGVNIYKAKDVDQFEEKIKLFLSGKLPSLVDEAYKVAIKKDIIKIGEELKNVYDNVLK